MTDKNKKTTAPIPSVGADGEQPLSHKTTGIITADDCEINYPDENSEEYFLELQRRLDRISDPNYLHTITLNEL